MQPTIQTSRELKLIGMHRTMSFEHYTVGELWREFTQRRSDIDNTVSSDLISMSIYSPNHFASFDPAAEFDRWAAVEVSDLNLIPSNMESTIVPSGLYAVFQYVGLSTDSSVFRYIFEMWLPQSDYVLDCRPHFEILGDKYVNNSSTSEEEIWIPIRPR